MLINQFDNTNRPLLESIQGNILKGHGRKYTSNLFLKGIKGRENLVKFWISELVTKEEPILKSCYSQLKSNYLYKSQGIKAGVFSNFFISALGYEFLEGKQAVQKAFKENKAFLAGMKKADLNDPEVLFWENGFQEEIHFMLLIASHDRAELNGVKNEILNSLESILEVLHIDEGEVILNEEGAGIEHFGYVDGVSQPLFFEDELSRYMQANMINNPSQMVFDPSATKELVLLEDPFVNKAKKSKESSYDLGSFLVYRKLEQNVRGFKKAEHDLAEKLGLQGEDMERVGAMIVGRFEDGTPIEVSGQDGMIGGAVFNNFDYDAKVESKCPFHGHIRKTNPRSTIPKAETHRMARRGIPYGKFQKDLALDEMPIKDVGLLFMSFQSSIENQFEFIQKQWANNADFPSFNPDDKPGLDLIIGQGKSQAKGAYAQKWGEGNTMQQMDFKQFVTMKGGEYFFAPSLKYLRNL